MGEAIKEFAKKVVESIKKIFTPSQGEVKDDKIESDSTTVNKPGQPGPITGPAGF